MKSITLPAGRYIIGDPCYNVPDENWQDLLDNADYFQDRCVGSYTRADGKVCQVVSFNTKYGDGEYTGGGMTFGVDAGMIGIMPADDVPTPDSETQLVMFERDFVCSEHNGVIQFGHIIIDTADEGDDLDDDLDDANDVGDLFHSLFD